MRFWPDKHFCFGVELLRSHNNGIADGSNGEVVDEEPHEHHDGLCVIAAYTFGVCGTDGTGCGEDESQKT